MTVYTNGWDGNFFVCLKKWLYIWQLLQMMACVKYRNYHMFTLREERRPYKSLYHLRTQLKKTAFVAKCELNCLFPETLRILEQCLL